MRLPLAFLVVAAGAAGLGCGLNQEGVAPPNDKLFFPGALKLDPGQRWLYVANANADLRFNNGTLVAIDLSLAQTDREEPRGHWPLCENVTFTSRPTIKDDQGNVVPCCWDQLDSGVLNCDEQAYIEAAATVRIGSFASAMVLQPYVLTRDADHNPVTTDPTRSRLLIGVRGNTSISVVDVHMDDAPTFTCTDPANGNPGPFPECDTTYRVTEKPDQPSDARLFVPDEPYALALDDTLETLYVGHLKGGFISFIDLSPYEMNAQPGTNLPRLVSVSGGIFPVDINGSSGVTSFTVKTPGLFGRVYATSRFLPRAGAFAPIPRDPSADVATVNNENTILSNAGDVFTTSLVGAETRGIQFVSSEAGERAFVLQRTPPALVGFQHDMVNNPPSDVIEVCDSPTFLDKMVLPDGEARLYVTCFDGGQVYVIDPYAARVVTIIEVGRGPAGLTFASNGFAYVTGFGANNVSVVDLRPGSLTENRVVQRIGFPTAVPF